MSITQWHEADEFWETLGPIFFEAERWQRAPGEIDRVVKLLGLVPDAPLLDLCCGPGRHSLELARRGFHVTGVDRTAAFLTMAQKDAEGLPVEFVQDDMRRFYRPEAYAGILNLYSSFGYFEDPADDLLAVDNMYRSLMPGGTLILEMQGKEILARHLRGRQWVEWDGGFLLEETEITQDWGWLQNRWIVITEGGMNQFLWGHRIYSAFELSALLRGAGFAAVTIYGDLSAVPYDQNANRLVAVAQKPE